MIARCDQGRGADGLGETPAGIHLLETQRHGGREPDQRHLAVAAGLLEHARQMGLDRARGDRYDVGMAGRALALPGNGSELLTWVAAAASILARRLLFQGWL